MVLKTRRRLGAELWSGVGAGRLGAWSGGSRGRWPLIPATRGRADRGFFPLRLQESCGEAVEVPTPPGTRRRGTRRHGAGVRCPIPTRARRLDTETGPRFQDKMSLPLSAVAPQTGRSVPGRTMQRFSPQPPRPAPRGSSTEEMVAWGRGSGPRSCGGSEKHRHGRALTAATEPRSDLVPGPATPCPGHSPAPGAVTPPATLSLDHRRCRHSSAPLTKVGHCWRFVRRELSGRWISRVGTFWG